MPIAGDLDQSGEVDELDFLLLVDSILEGPVPFETDVDHSGQTDAVDLQLVVRAALYASFNIESDNIDSDSDGLSDDAEANLGTQTDDPDTDGDGVGDGQEVAFGEDPLVANPEHIIINEFVAANDEGLQDEDLESSDWIELYNAGNSAVDLAGWALTDDEAVPGKWTFPAVTLGASEYLVVFASGKDRTPAGGGRLHTNFSLGAQGEYLALSNAGRVLQSSSLLDPEYPRQMPDISYGRHSGGGAGWWYFDPPTPGGPNGGGEVYRGFVTDTRFSVDRGFYDTAFALVLSTDTAGATIRYTLDGSTPTVDHGTGYGDPIPIGGTAIVRAAAFRSGWLPTNVDTQTYIFIDDVITQSPGGEVPGPGWPAGDVNGQVFDYAMDPNVVNDSRYTNLMDNALLSIPSISLVTDLPNLVDPTTGIYVNAIEDGHAWERPTSVELIDPDGNEEFQINAGLRIRGGSSRMDANPKHSFRLFFRDKYGDGKLRFPLFGDEGANEFDKIDLRTSMQYSWSLLQGSPPDYWQVGHLCTMNRDVFNRDTQRDMGHPYTRSRYYHLYLNGVYWGLYQSQERGEARFAATYFGGSKDDYDVIKVDSGIGESYDVVATDGTVDAWHRLWDEAVAGFGSDEPYYRVQGLNPDGSPNATYENLLDVGNLIDYMLLIYYGGNLDAPITWFGSNASPNNFYLFYNRNAPDGFKALIHDAEHTLLLGNILGEGDELYRDRTGPFPAGDVQQKSNPQWIHQQLVAHPEYRMQFADHAHRHFFNGGTLTPDVADARFLARANEIAFAIIAESARWGDSTILPARTKDDDWQLAVDDIRDTYFPNRTYIVLNQIRNKGWYPNVDAPVFSMNGAYQHGGYAADPNTLSMTNPNGSGTVYYTLDGSDPRQPSTVSDRSDTTIVTEDAAKKVLVPTGSGDLVRDGSFWVTYFESKIPIYDLGTAYDDVIANPDNQLSVFSEPASVVNYLNTGDNGHYGYDSPFPGTAIGSDVNDFAVSVSGTIFIPEAGEWTFGVNSDEGFWMSIGPFVHIQDGLRLPADSLEVLRFSSPGPYSLYLFSFDRVGGSELELFAAQGNYADWNAADFDLVGDTANGGLKVIASDGFWASPEFDDSAWTPGSGGVGYETTGSYGAYFDTDVETGMYNRNGTVCIRIPFTLTADQVASFEFLTLRMRYDDGFVAYINGVEAARANAPSAPVWNSNATADHVDSAAVVLEDFPITTHVKDLMEGINILAIQGLNVTTGSSDFLISPALVAGAFIAEEPFVAPGADPYSEPFALLETTHVKARVEDGGEWSALNEATFVFPAGTHDLRITEIMYHPLNPDAEFIELRNVGVQTINLVNTAFTEGIHFTFPDMAFVPGTYILLVRDAAVFDSVYGPGLPVAGEYAGSLDDRGERIRLEDPTGAAILDFEYNDGWYPITDGDDFSLTILDAANEDTSMWDQRDGWRASSLAGGSPGADDANLVPESGAVLINEVLAHSHEAAPDWIELHNTTAFPVSIGGWFLSDDGAEPMKYEIAAGTSIPAAGYIVFYEDVHFANVDDPGCHTPFALSEIGESVYLSSSVTGQLAGYREDEDFGASESNVAFGRHAKSTGTFNFVAMSSNTPGEANAYPKVGPVVIHEIMYHPTSGGGDAEYVELHNISGNTVLLDDGDGNAWKFTRGIDFTFALGTAIPPDGYLLVVKDPWSFPDWYTVPAGVGVFGPYTGRLDNGGETLEISMPGDVNGRGERQYVRIDRVNYDDEAPWPTSPDGGGFALGRKVAADYGNDVANWEAATPSPGD